MENEYLAFMDDGKFDISEEDDGETITDISDFIAQLESIEALEHISMVRVWIGSLYSRKALLEALSVFISKSTKLTKVLLHQYDYECQSYDIGNVIDYLKVFRNVPKVSVIIDADEYYNIEIDPLINFFNDYSHPVTIKHFSVDAHFLTALDIIDAVQSNNIIETIDLKVRYVDTIDPNMPLKLTSKLRKLTFVYKGNNTGFDAFFENMIVSNPSVTRLDLRSCRMTIDTITVITTNIQDLETLIIRHVTMMMFELLIKTSTISNLVKLDIKFDYLKVELTNLFAHNMILKTLLIGSYIIGMDNIIEILKSLADSTSIKNFNHANIYKNFDTQLYIIIL